MALTQNSTSYWEHKAAVFLQDQKGKQDSSHLGIYSNSVLLFSGNRDIAKVALSPHPKMVALEPQNNLTPKTVDGAGCKRPRSDSAGSRA